MAELETVPAPAARSRSGRQSRQAQRGSGRAQPIIAGIDRQIPTYELLGEEGLARIEAAIDVILKEVGIDFRGDARALELWHVDLYRLGSAGEIAELGLEEAFGGAICLVEWADRLGLALPARRLMLGFEIPPGEDDVRRARIEAHGSGWDWLPMALGAAA